MHHRERVTGQRICRENIHLCELKRGHTFGNTKLTIVVHGSVFRDANIGSPGKVGNNCIQVFPLLIVNIERFCTAPKKSSHIIWPKTTATVPAESPHP